VCGTIGHVTAYLFGFVIGASDVAPLFDDSAEVDAVERNVNLPDLVVFGKPVEVVYGEYQRLGAHFGIRHLQRDSIFLFIYLFIYF